MGRHPKNSAILMVLSSISMAGIELATASALSRNGARLMSRAAAAAATPLRLVHLHIRNRSLLLLFTLRSGLGEY